MQVNMRKGHITGYNVIMYGAGYGAIPYITALQLDLFV